MENNLEVAVRIRPPIQSSHLVEDVCLYADPYAKEVVLANQLSFFVDHALALEISQSQLFDDIVSQRIDYMLQGYDVSFIAYGHVNSGKTYTMLGPGLHCALSETTYGVLPRSGRQIFNRLVAFRQRFGLQFNVSISFIEICNEEAKDLLASTDVSNSGGGGVISFKSNDRGLTTICGVEQVECHTACEMFNCLRLGMSRRKTIRTALNSLSSLSHCVVVIKVEQKWVSNQGKLETIASQAMFVDLAGSEQMFLMSPVDSDRAQHSTVGNIGLGVISAVIASFSGQWLPSSPFTQSLLFPLLKDSFIGTIKTLLFCCLSPSSTDYSETLNSLRLIEHIHSLNRYSLLKDTIVRSVNVGNGYQNGNESSEDNRKEAGGLEFAASQWLKLVSNAEDLFNRLVDNNMTDCTREEITEWLCLKQECEECFSVETTNVINNNNNSNNNNINEIQNGARSLEMIEEVTETDTKSKSDKSSDDSDSLSVESSISDNESSVDSNVDEFDGQYRNLDDCCVISGDVENSNSIHLKEITSEQESINLCRDDFSEKLNRLMSKFVQCTDETVDRFLIVSTPERNALEREREREAKNVNVITKPNNCNIGRRKSILPCGNRILLSDATSDQKKETNESKLKKTDSDVVKCEQPVELGAKDRLEHCKVIEPLSNSDTLDCSTNSKKELKNLIEPVTLTLSGNIKQSQLGLANLDLEAASKRVDRLQSMIKIKEQFIEEMIKNSGTRISAKAKFQRKHLRLEEEYHNAKIQLAKAEEALSHEMGSLALKSQVQKCKDIADRYEKRLHDIEMIKQIAGDSAKKVLELENSLHNSKRKMQKLRKQMKKEEEHKTCLEAELIEDQKKVQVLEERFKTHSDKLKGEILKANGVESTQIDRSSENKKSMSLHKFTQPQEKQMLLERQEPFHQNEMGKGLLHVSARISHLENMLKEKSIDSGQQGKEALKHEIRNLRKTRDHLLEERKSLDVKLTKDKVLTAVEERKFIECDEAIEAIDTTIEYKNQLICGGKGLMSIIENNQHEKSGEMLLLRLMKLSTVEMQILLYKYFQKVVDLRESGRKMETQITELDRHSETQAWKIQALSNALQQAHLESERRLIASQKEHQQKLHLIFRHFADETSGHSSGADDTEKCRRQNKVLKQRILELEAMLFKPKTSERMKSEAGTCSMPTQELQPVPPASRLNIPHHNLKQLGGAMAPHTTKVTRQKNKLIIQQQKTDKKPPK